MTFGVLNLGLRVACLGITGKACNLASQFKIILNPKPQALNHKTLKDLATSGLFEPGCEDRVILTIT